MNNPILINEAVKLVNEIYEAEGIMENTESIRRKVQNWYDHTDITSAEMLASASMLGDYSPSISYDDIVRLCEYYFYEPDPDIVDHRNYYSIDEFEDSYRDDLWR